MPASSASSPRRSGPSAGFWSSWVTPELMAGRALGLAEPRVAGDRLYWLESRPREKGRVVLVSLDKDGTILDETPPPFDLGTHVHEYGGAPYAVAPDGRIVTSDRKAGVVRLRHAAGTWREIAGDCESGARYADFAFDTAGAGLLAVREAEAEGLTEPRASIVWLGPDGRQVELLAGADFYAAPRVSPDGSWLAWIEWAHPDMPWDATRLCLAPIERSGGEVTLGPARVLAGADGVCSVIEPVWTPEGNLLANSDARDGWAPVRFAPARNWAMEWLPDPGGETGFPHWVFGQRTLTPLPGGALLALVVRDGIARVRLLRDGIWEDTALSAPFWSPEPFGDGFAWLDAPPDAPAAIVTGRPGETTCSPHLTHRPAFALPDSVAAVDISSPAPLRFPTSDGAEAHALFYPPANARHSLAPGEKPPLLVMAHGGPTGRAGTAFAFKVQWWTSRGFAVLDVNYRGSTGFGRAYRTALEGRWGLLDVMDCIDAVRHVLARNLADPARCFMRGSSAGGLTVLEALATCDLFTAGTSLYGVTDLRALAQETHKFEARYLDRLIGPWPEAEALYVERSPLFHPERIHVPVLFLHGGQDRVVPLAQAERMAASLRANGTRAELHVYPDEGHGFRQRETIMDSFARELTFYRGLFPSARR
ncbi:S9 family peptidase [Acidomonas methanolica]|nr:prolyl oligopeptidase family serine peptidase [Acidomonas methanolica]